MVESITNNFLRNEEERLLEENIKIARKSALEIETRVSASLKAAEKVLSSVEDISARRELQKQIEEINNLASIRKDLKDKNKKISTEEANTLLNTYKSFNSIIQENEHVVKALKKQGEDLEELDIRTPLKKASEKLGKNFSSFFASNISSISQAGLGQSAANLALSSISPELAFATELAGIDFGNMFSSLSDKLFSSEDLEEEEEQDFERLQTSINNLSELEQTLHEDSEVTSEDNTQDIVDAIEEQTRVYQDSIDDLVQADQIRNEENLVIAEDQHNELIEINDDIRDNQQGSIFSKFFGAGSPLGRAIKGLMKPLTTLGGLLVTFGNKLKNILGPALSAVRGRAGAIGGGLAKAGALVGKAGLVGLAGAAGYGIGTFINDNLISEDVGRMIGDFIGPPIDSVVNFFKGIPSWLQEKFKVITNFDYKGFIQPKIDSILNFFNGIPDFVSTAFDKIKSIDGEVVLSTIKDIIVWPFKNTFEFFSDPKSKIKEWLAFAQDSPILQSIGDVLMVPFNSMKEFISSPLEKIKEWLNIDPNVDLLDSILEVLLAPFESIGDFFNNPTEKIKDFFTSSFIEEPTEEELKVQQMHEKIGYEEPSLVGFFKDRVKTVSEAVQKNTRNLINSNETSNNVYEFINKNDMESANKEIDLKIDPNAPSANELESNISQMELVGSINQMSVSQEKLQNNQTKELVKVIQKQEENQKKMNSSYRGKRSLDNSPVVSDDIGLIMTLGGGL